MQETFLSDNQLAERYGVSRITVWRWHKTKRDFPRVIKLSEGCARWRLSEIEAWEASKAEPTGSSRNGAGSRADRQQLHA